MSDLTEFLLARVAEDEAAFTLPEWTPDCGGDWCLSADGFFANYWPDNTVCASAYRGDVEVATSGIVSLGSRAECQVFAERWVRDHSRVLAECEAKRRIVEECADLAYSAGVFSTAEEDLAVTILRMLAQPYAPHEQFREEWRV